VATATCRTVINFISSPILNFMKIHSLGGEFIPADNQTGDRINMTKVRDDFHDSGNVHKNHIKNRMR
jgi:hypothetical protein